MPNAPDQAAGEAVPNMNRRSLLIGLATASVTAAGATTATAAASEASENGELLRLGNELPAVSAGYLAAREERWSILAKWSPLWPVAPEELTTRGGKDIERSLDRHAIIREGNESALSVITTDDLQWYIDRAQRVLKGKTIDGRKIAGLTRPEWEESLEDDLATYAIAERYEAECNRIREASGYGPALAAYRDARTALMRLISDIMAQSERTMTGVIIKAQALSLTGEDDLFLDVAIPGRKWASELSASVLKIAGEKVG